MSTEPQKSTELKGVKGANETSLRPNSSHTPSATPMQEQKINIGQKAHKANELFEVGLQYYNGRDIPKDIKKAASYFKAAAEQGHVGAQLNIGYCYENGEGIPQDAKEAAKWYQLAADQGNARAQAYLGSCYQCGIGVEKADIKEAIRLYKLAVAQEDALAQRELGQCYQSGEGVEKNIKEAIRLYRLAAAQGDNMALGNLMHLTTPTSTASSPSSSTTSSMPSLVESRATGGDGPITNNISREPSDTEREDMKKPHKTIGGYGNVSAESQKSTELQEVKGANETSLLPNSSTILPATMVQEQKVSVKGYSQDQEALSAEELFNIGMDCEDGIGGRKDMKVAASYYRPAAEKGHVGALLALGYCYKRGQGVPYDTEEAVKLFQRAVNQAAANQEDASAQFWLGYHYYSVEGNMKEAAKCFKLAVERGSTDASTQFFLGLCYFSGKGIEKNTKEAARLFRLAAAQGHSAAQCNLGICYAEGNNVVKDKNEALHLFRLAAGQGDVEARMKLVALGYEEYKYKPFPPRMRGTPPLQQRETKNPGSLDKKRETNFSDSDNLPHQKVGLQLQAVSNLPTTESSTSSTQQSSSSSSVVALMRNLGDSPIYSGKRLDIKKEPSTTSSTPKSQDPPTDFSYKK